MGEFKELLNEQRTCVFGKNCVDVFRLRRRYGLAMQDLESRLGKFLEFNEKVSSEIAKEFAESEFEKYRIVQDQLVRSDCNNLIEAISEDKDDK